MRSKTNAVPSRGGEAFGSVVRMEIPPACASFPSSHDARRVCCCPSAEPTECLLADSVEGRSIRRRRRRRRETAAPVTTRFPRGLLRNLPVAMEHGSRRRRDGMATIGGCGHGCTIINWADTNGAPSCAHFPFSPTVRDRTVFRMVGKIF